jgi:aconitase B
MFAPCACCGELRRQLVHQAAQAAHLLHLADLRLEVFEVEAAGLLDLLGQLLGGFHVHAALGFLDQREDVAHAQDPLGHAVGVERLQAVELFADADELDRRR